MDGVRRGADMSGVDSKVPLDLQQQLANSTNGGVVFGRVFELLPPENRPDCPACGNRLAVQSIVSNGPDTLIAARLLCPNHPTTKGRLYVYEHATETLYFDGYPTRVKPTMQETEDDE